MAILFAILGNMQAVAGAIAVGAAIGLLCCAIAYFVTAHESDAGEKRIHEQCGRLARRVSFILGAALVITLAPSANDLWRTRLALVKYELASSENVQKGAAEIARIASKLECKYLGGAACEESK